MTNRQARWVFTAVVVAGIIMVGVVILGWGAPPPITICRTMTIVTIYGNTSDDPTVRLLRADTTIVVDTIPGGCPGDTP